MYGHTIQSPYITIHYHTLPYIDHHTYIHWSLHHPCFLFTDADETSDEVLTPFAPINKGKGKDDDINQANDITENML